jgi:hypothetical protein
MSGHIVIWPLRFQRYDYFSLYKSWKNTASLHAAKCQLMAKFGGGILLKWNIFKYCRGRLLQATQLFVYFLSYALYVSKLILTKTFCYSYNF